jgi:hypothetical protein
MEGKEFNDTAFNSPKFTKKGLISLKGIKQKHKKKKYKEEKDHNDTCTTSAFSIFDELERPKIDMIKTETELEFKIIIQKIKL